MSAKRWGEKEWARNDTQLLGLGGEDIYITKLHLHLKILCDTSRRNLYLSLCARVLRGVIFGVLGLVSVFAVS
jgi:hypothetical protein